MLKPAMIAVVGSLLILIAGLSPAGQADEVRDLSLLLEKQAAELALNSLDHFRGWEGEISDQEQAVLFKAECFAASARLFSRLSQDQSGYFRSGYLRTNLYNAFMFLARSFRELEEEMRRAGVMPYALSDCRKILDRMDGIFSGWPAPDNLAYLHQKYIKASDDTVYMIERKGAGQYILHPFKNLESLYRYNYDLSRGKDPWKFLVEVPEDALRKMPVGEMIDLTFEGRLIIEQSSRPNRSVYLIQGGRKRGITSPRVLDRFGGWSRVFEVPSEIIESYPEGEPIR